MDETFSGFPFLDWRLIFSHLTHLAVAYALALPVAWDRERDSRSAGLRTFPPVAVASRGFIPLGVRALGGSPESLARTVQGLMTGIGFIGGGAILKEGANGHGAATAASIRSEGP